MKGLLKSGLRIALAVLIGGTLCLVIFEKSLIYYPARTLEGVPGDLGLPSEEVLLDVEPGVKIHAWFIKAASQPSIATVLFSHGNAGNIGDRLDRVRSWKSLGVDVLLYDYRGFGRSTGSPDEEGTYRDGRAAYDYLVNVRHVDPSKLVLMGESLGCAISIQLALDRKAAGLILEAPFASIRRMAAAIYPFLPLGPFVRTRYDNLGKASRLNVPLLVVQGTLDEVIPIEQGKAVFAAAPEPKTFIAMEGAHHNDVYLIGGEAYRRAVAALIERATRDAPPLIETKKP